MPIDVTWQLSVYEPFLLDCEFNLTLQNGTHRVTIEHVFLKNVTIEDIPLQFLSHWRYISQVCLLV